ncbi:MAG: hypothetical protein Q9191_004086 [Dirinaria sp. TL-2023a]
MSSSTKGASAAHNNAGGDGERDLPPSADILPADDPGSFMCYSKRCLGCLEDLEELDKTHRTTFTSCPVCDVPRRSYKPRADRVGSRNVFFPPSLKHPQPSRSPGVFIPQHSIEEQQNAVIEASASSNDDHRAFGSSPALGLGNWFQATAAPKTRAHAAPTSGQTPTSDPSSTPFTRSIFGVAPFGAHQAPSTGSATSPGDVQRPTGSFSNQSIATNLSGSERPTAGITRRGSLQSQPTPPDASPAISASISADTSKSSANPSQNISSTSGNRGAGNAKHAKTPDEKSLSHTGPGLSQSSVDRPERPFGSSISTDLGASGTSTTARGSTFNPSGAGISKSAATHPESFFNHSGTTSAISSNQSAMRAQQLPSASFYNHVQANTEGSGRKSINFTNLTDKSAQKTYQESIKATSAAVPSGSPALWRQDNSADGQFGRKHAPGQREPN